jgi:hypothetical protein
MSIRSFSLNDPEAYDIICRRRAPADRNPRGAAPVKVTGLMDSAFERDTLAEAQTAFEEWQGHVDNEGSAGLRSSGRSREERQDQRHADSLRVTASDRTSREGRFGLSRPPFSFASGAP